MLSNYQKMDINILLSMVNMKLRNEQQTLDNFCVSYLLDKEILLQRFTRHSIRYDRGQNQFKDNA